MRARKRFDRFVTSCVEAKGEDITAMMDFALPITYRTFAANVGPKGIAQIRRRFGYSKNGMGGLTLTKDWSLSFYRAKYLGELCYVFQHSRIEYVFVQSN